MLPALLAGLIGIHLFLIIKHGESHFPSKED
jgi:quinol-cytochrome oxidoreductase complex cytochrome b subunit